MNILKQITRFTKTPLTKLLSSTPITSLFTYIIQSYFFSESLTSLLQVPLSLINFPYSNFILSNSFTKLLLTLLLFSVKIWEYEESRGLEAYAYLCASFVGLYVYDGCVRLAEGYVGRVRGLYWGQVVGYVGVVMVVPVAMLLAGYGEGVGVGIGIVLAVLTLILATINAIKNKHIIYSAIVCLIYFSIPFLRNLNNKLPYNLYIPV